MVSEIGQQEGINVHKAWCDRINSDSVAIKLIDIDECRCRFRVDHLVTMPPREVKTMRIRSHPNIL